MPPDSHLLPAVSKALLRAARAGCIYVRSSGRSANDEDKEMADGEDQGAGTGHSADRSFTSRRWMTLPKNIEPPEPEFLAKRRPGLPSLYGGTAAVDGGAPGPMRRTKFKKVDPETGNISIYEAWVPEGHLIEGEITGDVQTIAEQSEVPVKPETPAPGTVVEGVGVVNSEGVVVAEAGSAAVMTPPKRRPPPPKRKGKGIGKGRKKKVMFAPGEGADAEAVHGAAPTAERGVDGVSEGPEGSQMSVDQSGQEEEDDGEEGEESDEGDESMMDAKTPETPGAQSGAESTPQPPADTPAEAKDVDMADAAPETQPSAVEPSTSAEQDTASQPPTDTKIETPQTDAEASATPAPTVEKTEEAVHEKPADTTEEQAAAPTEASGPADEPKGEAVPKEDSQAPEPVPLPAGDNAAASNVEGEAAPEVADVTANEVKTEAPGLGVDASLPAPASASPEKPTQEASAEPVSKPSESEQPADAVQQPQTEPEATEAENPEASSAPDSKEDVAMAEAPEGSDQPAEQVQAEESTANPASASPSPPPTTDETDPPTSGADIAAPESAAPELSNTHPDGTATAQDTKTEEGAPDAVPVQSESAVEGVEEKKEDSEAPPAPAAESA